MVLHLFVWIRSETGTIAVKLKSTFMSLWWSYFPQVTKGYTKNFFWENATEIDTKLIIFKHACFCFLSFVFLIYFYLRTRTYWSDYSDLKQNLFKGRFLNTLHSVNMWLIDENERKWSKTFLFHHTNVNALQEGWKLNISPKNHRHFNKIWSQN